MVAPRWRPLPDNLHWSYWESYSTWLTGFALFTVLYLFNAGTFLVDKSVHDWSAGAAIAASLAFLAVFWISYDLICRLFGQTRRGDQVVGLAVLGLVVFASWLACQLFAGRAAFVLVGAMMATAMSANVFFWIMSQRRGQAPGACAGSPRTLGIRGGRGTGADRAGGVAVPQASERRAGCGRPCRSCPAGHSCRGASDRGPTLRGLP